jgi:hypothetical protein
MREEKQVVNNNEKHMNAYYNINNGVIKNNQRVFVMSRGFSLGKLHNISL